MTQTATSTRERPPTQRELQKEQTRGRVVAAARALFGERGYEAATIRDIAKRAGVAPGSVFTTFASKAELLRDILYSKYEALVPMLEGAAALPGAAPRRIVRMASIAYDFEMGEIRLVAEMVGASWSWPLKNEQENRRWLEPVYGYIDAILKDAKKSGEIGEQADVPLLVDSLVGLYVRNFRRAVYDGWNAAQLTDYYERQVAVVLAGAAPR